jgi:hypothetical protein
VVPSIACRSHQQRHSDTSDRCEGRNLFKLNFNSLLDSRLRGNDSNLFLKYIQISLSPANSFVEKYGMI